jgi:uncharacterized membrane protein YdbT with pleckstrin-like domain
MAKAFAANRPQAIEDNQIRRGHTELVLSEKPDLRLIKLGYIVPLLLLVTGGGAIILPIDNGYKIGTAYAVIMLLGGSLTFFLSAHARLRKASYTVTAEYIEAETGTFEKSIRRIPLSYIRDVTHRQNFFQTFFGISDIAVAATNGDSVVLENISDGRRKQEVIWDLVIAKSPHASRPRT